MTGATEFTYERSVQPQPKIGPSGDPRMERSQVLDAMGQLKFYGMKAACNEIIATAMKSQHKPQKVVGELLTAEISEKH